MVPAASSEGIEIFCPKNGRISFFNSPYYAHHKFSAIDIYADAEFGDLAPSPIRGVVKETRKVKCPTVRSFHATDYDYVLSLQSYDNSERWIKMLHVQPLVKSGDIIDVGTPLGAFLRTGFFDFWTDPHIHVEIRNPSNPIRATGGYKLKRIAQTNHTVVSEKTMEGTVANSRLEYTMIVPNTKMEFGFPVNLNDQTGILDAGIPQYNTFGVHTKEKPPSSGYVSLCGKKLGYISSTHDNMCLVKTLSVSFFLKKKQVNLSFFLYPTSRQLVKIIPLSPGQIKLEEGEQVSIKISAK